MTTVRSFNDEIKALEEYGHDCCARIDDKIHEYCERIKKAHEDEVAAVYLALRLKELQDFGGYDVLDNERHKAVCELRKSDFTLYTPEQFVETLYKMLYMTGGTPTNIYVTQKAVRDKLIHLLGGDLKEDDDGVDAGRCVNADSGSPDVPAAECDGDCVHHQVVQGLAPITKELRDAMEHYCNFKDENRVQLGEREFDQLCDSIDAVHNGLERENEELHKYPIWAPESHYMLLPKDTDGAPIHVGDVMEWVDIEGTVEVTCTVEAVGVSCFFAWDKANKRFAQKLATSYRHHKPDTWEQIIEDALDGYHDTDFDALVARCKALAGDADE